MKIGDIENPSFYTVVETLKTAEAASDLLAKRRGYPAVVINDIQYVIDDPKVAACFHRSIDEYIRRLKSEIRRRVISDF